MKRTPKKRKHAGYGPGQRYYDTGKVKIGLAYEPPPRQPTQEEERVQRALLFGAKRSWLPRVCPYTTILGIGVLSAACLFAINLWRNFT